MTLSRERTNHSCFTSLMYQNSIKTPKTTEIYVCLELFHLACPRKANAFPSTYRDPHGSSSSCLLPKTDYIVNHQEPLCTCFPVFRPHNGKEECKEMK